MIAVEGGIVIGEVSSLDDPDRIGRIQVTYPHLNDQVSAWARLVTPMAGPTRRRKSSSPSTTAATEAT